MVFLLQRVWKSYEVYAHYMEAHLLPLPVVVFNPLEAIQKYYLPL